MTKRLGYALLVTLVGGSLSLSGCSDDQSSAEENGGSAGASDSDAGSKTGGSASGGSSNKAGATSGGTAGNGTAGTSPGGGTANAGGATEGGSAGAAGTDAGAGGAGGAGEPQLVYACGSDTQYKKVCSAKVAAGCPEPTDCADCVGQVSDDYDGAITGCATCDALVDQYYQCGVDAFESGNSAAGMQCIDGVGADFSDQCSAFFFDYFDCGAYLNKNACPATWPPQ